MNIKIFWLLFMVLWRCFFSLFAEDWIIAYEEVLITEPMEYQGDIIIGPEGILHILRDFTLTGNIYLFSNGVLDVENCSFTLKSVYNGQYALIASENSTVTLTGVLFSSQGMQAGIITVGDAVVTIQDSSFADGVIQPILFERGMITIQRALGLFEVIISDEASFYAEDIPPIAQRAQETWLWVWPFFTKGNQATLTYPSPGRLDTFTFPGPMDQVGFSYSLTNVNVLIWPLALLDQCQIHLVNNPQDRNIIIGLEIFSDATLTLKNQSYYEHFQVPLPDRDLILDHTFVQTWNLYPMENTQLRVKNSVIGELLDFESSQTFMENSVVDGSGGFLGVRSKAKLYLSGCQVSTAVEVTDQGFFQAIQSELLPHPSGVPSRLTLTGEAKVYLHNTELPETLVFVDPNCFPVSFILPVDSQLQVVLALGCQGKSQTFDAITLQIQSPYTGDQQTLYNGTDITGLNTFFPLPSWCLSPCHCQARLSFTVEGQTLSLTQDLCKDPLPHPRPF